MEIDLNQFYVSLGTIAVVIGVGFLLGKLKLINENTNRQLVNLLLTLFMPAALFRAFPSSFSREALNTFLAGLLAGALVMIMVILAAKVIYNRRLYRGDLGYMAQFAFIFNNATFFGYPLVSSAFGEAGIIPYCGFIVAFNVALFSYGVWLFERKLSGKFFLKVITNPNIIAVALGMLVFLLQIEVPAIVENSVGYVAGATTPLSLICIGYMLSAAQLVKVLKKWRLFLIAILQLVLAPLLTYGLVKLCGFSQDVVMICTLMQAVPTATSLGLFAEKYGRDASEASELVVISTLMSLITLPIIVTALFG